MKKYKISIPQKGMIYLISSTSWVIDILRSLILELLMSRLEKVENIVL